MATAPLIWQLRPDGAPHASSRKIPGEQEIPPPPGDDYYWQNGWKQKSQADKDKDKDDKVDKRVLDDPFVRALVLTMSELHSLTEKQITDMIKAHYKTL